MSSPSSSPQNAAVQESKNSYAALASVIRPYSQTPWPIWSVAGIFLGSAFLPSNARRPPLMYRFGFGAVFAGAGYVLSTGDARNGSGISTAWSLMYLFLNLRSSLRRPVLFSSVLLSGATIASSALYGSEYFLLQEE
ncbi:hypothetical protein C8Q75DRAFT_811640 [Abortiporus biennis]|nr:hypothetical protein C8Q75DRAFT_811640 [Abortiporus biennis]